MKNYLAVALVILLCISPLYAYQGIGGKAGMGGKAGFGGGAPAGGASPVASVHGFGSTSGTQLNLTVNTALAGSGWFLMVSIGTGSITPTSVTDGSSGGGTADTIQQAGACDSTNAGKTACMYYICHSTLNNGNFTFTVNLPSSQGVSLLADSYTGVLNTGLTNCLDTNVTKFSGNTASGNPTFTSTGNVLEAHEVAEEYISSSQVPTPNNGWTQIQISGGNESANWFNPTSGSTISASWSMSSGNWEAGMMALRSATP